MAAASPQDIAVSELSPGFFLTRAETPPPPLVLSSPHSGRAYPPAFVAASALDLAGLRRAEDAWVDELLEPATRLGVPLIAARWGRAFIDLNRAPDEIDAAMLSDPASMPEIRTTPRVRSGLGVLPRLTGPGLDIYTARFPASVALARIEAVHAPYHRRISALLDAAMAANGEALLLDVHSMPPLSMPPRIRPHFVVGDANGASAPDALVRRVEAFLRRAGYRTARNAPYSGGFTTRSHADRSRGRHVVQIEIDRTLYMDVETLERHEGAAAIAALMRELVSDLRDWLSPRAIAAE